MLDSAGMAVNQAVSLWQESMGIFYGVRLLNNAAERFHFRAEAFHMGEVVLTSYRCVAQSFDRSRSRIGRDGLDHITLQFCVSGSHGRRDGGLGEKAEPGDLIIADLAQAQATGTSDFDSLNLTVPRRLFAPLLKAPDEQNMRVISGASPLVALLRNHLQGLFNAAGAMNGKQAEVVMGPTLELAAAAINGAVAQESVSSVEFALAGQIRRFVDERIADPDMTAERVAGLFGISTRKLYYLFEPHGGFSTYVVEARLRRCRDELVNPAHRRESIANIAGRYGFIHRKSFVRAFRRTYEISPREMRALAEEGRRLPAEPLKTDDVWRWIRELR